MKRPVTRRWQPIQGLALALVLGCGQRQSSEATAPLSPSRAAAVEESVRAFMRTVAQDVTQEGPLAWRKQFEDGPQFYMASEGALVFSNGAAVTPALQGLVRTYQHLELKWGDNLRVDPLTVTLAAVAVPYSEVQVSATGERRVEKGFFTGTAEYRDGRWQFRNAHWSVTPPSAASH